jgi:hypothetical protein
MTVTMPHNWDFFGLPGGADSHRLATHSNQASPTAGGPRQSLTSTTVDSIPRRDLPLNACWLQGCHASKGLPTHRQGLMLTNVPGMHATT